MTTLGVIAFIIALLVSIMLHEAGHLVTAKRFGMKATQFFVGFGPTIWSRHKGETEYGVKALPLGGFVKILGMTPLEEIRPEDEKRAFYRQPGWPRAIVLGAGSATHLVLAFGLLLIMAMGLGLPRSGDPTLTVASVSECTPATPTSACAPDDPPSPAVKAGLRPGDRITAFGGERVNNWNAFAKAIDERGPGPVALTVERGGEQRTLHANLTQLQGTQDGFLGITSKVPTTMNRLGPIEGAEYAGHTFGRMIVLVGQVLGDLPSALPSMFSEDRAESAGGSAGSIVGAARFSGQLFTVDVPLEARIFSFLGLVVSLNIFVGLFNLLPLLPLDGGHLAVLGYEKVRSRLAVLRGRADPGPVDMRKLLPATYLVVVLLIGLGVLLVLADIFNPLNVIQ